MPMGCQKSLLDLLNFLVRIFQQQKLSNLIEKNGENLQKILHFNLTFSDVSLVCYKRSRCKVKTDVTFRFNVVICNKNKNGVQNFKSCFSKSPTSVAYIFSHKNNCTVQQGNYDSLDQNVYSYIWFSFCSKRWHFSKRKRLTASWLLLSNNFHLT